MAITLGSAYGKIALDVADVLQGTKRGQDALLNFTRVSEQVGEKLKDVGKTLTIGLTLPITAMGAASIKAASDFEETRTKASVVFGEMADSVIANAKRAGTALGISQTQYLDYASAIGAALKAGGMSVSQATELSEQAVKHFADLASFHNGQVEDIAASWQSAIRGQFEPIQRFFPFITQQYLLTYGTANGLIDANTKQLTANERAIILNAIAMDERLNPAIDDFAETSDGLANRTRSMQARWEDLLVLLGTHLLPIAQELVGAITSMLERFNALTPVQQKILLGFLGFLAVLGPVLSGLGTLMSVVSTVSSAMGILSTAGVSLSSIGAMISGVAVPAAAALGSALLPILAIVASLILIIGIFAAAWVTDFAFIRTTTESVIKILRALWGAFTAFLRGDSDAAKEHLEEAWTAVMEHFEKVFGKLEGIRNAWLGFLRWIQDAFTSLVRFVRDVFANVDWRQLGEFLIMGIVHGLLGGIPSLVTAAMRAADAALDAIKDRLGISSPSKAFQELGRFSADGFQLGLAQAMSAEDIARTMIQPVNQISSSQQQTVIQNFSDGLTVRKVQSMIDQSMASLINQIINNLGPA